MSQSEKSNKTYIISGVLIGLILFFALITWIQNRDDQIAQPFKANKTENPFAMEVYYFPSRKSDAKALTFYFEEEGYTVNMLPSSNLDSLKASKTGPSYIYFNQSEFKQAMEIKQKIEKVIGYPVNAYRYTEFQVSPSMIMVFTEEGR